MRTSCFQFPGFFWGCIVMKKFFALILSLCCVATAISQVGAQEMPKKLPKMGVLASTGGGALSNYDAPDVWGGNDISGDEEPPIMASIVRTSPEKWTVNITNTTDDPYSISIRFTQTADGGRSLNSNSFSFSLRPKESASESVTANSSSTGGIVTLTNWKNNAPKKKPTAEAEGQTEVKK